MTLRRTALPIDCITVVAVFLAAVSGNGGVVVVCTTFTTWKQKLQVVMMEPERVIKKRSV